MTNKKRRVKTDLHAILNGSFPRFWINAVRTEAWEIDVLRTKLWDYLRHDK